MKKNLHPKYEKTTIKCACGNSIETKTTVAGGELKIDICSHCHPFFTGKQKLIDSAGRVERFNKKFNRTTSK